MKYLQLPPLIVPGRGFARGATTAGGKHSARISIAARTAIHAVLSTPASAGTAAAISKFAAGSGGRSALATCGGGVVPIAGRTRAAPGRSAAGGRPADRNASAVGAGIVVGRVPVPQGMYVRGRILARLSGNARQTLNHLLHQ